MKKDDKDEGIGIVAIVLMIVLAGIGLYYFLGTHSNTTTPDVVRTSVPVETPSPPPVSEQGNHK